MLFREYAPKPMVRLIAVAAVALAVATSAQAMSPAPLHRPDATRKSAHAAPTKYESLVSACLAPPMSAEESPAGVWHGMVAFAVSTMGRGDFCREPQRFASVPPFRAQAGHSAWASIHSGRSASLRRNSGRQWPRVLLRRVQHEPRRELRRLGG